MIAMNRSQSVPAAESQLAVFPQTLIIPLDLSQPMFRAWTEQILAEFGTSHRFAGCAFNAASRPREGPFAFVPTAAIAGASTTAFRVATASTAAIRKLHSAQPADG